MRTNKEIRQKWSNIPQLPTAHYKINVSWDYLEDCLSHWAERSGSGIGGLVMDPDYQRSHVWTRAQQTAYVEYVLAGGEVGKVITWNSPGWGGDYGSPIELVDGKQRIEAVRAFMRGEFQAYGMTADAGDDFGIHCDFVFRVCSLKTRVEILRLYLNINAGGTPHTSEEIDRVRKLLREAESASNHER